MVHEAAVRGFVEYNDLIAGHAYGTSRPPGITYTSSVYRHGYTHDHMPLGHPAGGDVTLASVGLLVQTAAARVALVGFAWRCVAHLAAFCRRPDLGPERQPSTRHRRTPAAGRRGLVVARHGAAAACAAGLVAVAVVSGEHLGRALSNPHNSEPAYPWQAQQRVRAIESRGGEE